MNIRNLLNNEITQDEYLRYNNTTLFFKKLPNEINGLIVRKNDINIIIINSSLNLEEKRRQFLHELCHLELNHTYKYNFLSNDTDFFENEVHNYINSLNFE